MLRCYIVGRRSKDKIARSVFCSKAHTNRCPIAASSAHELGTAVVSSVWRSRALETLVFMHELKDALSDFEIPA